MVAKTATNNKTGYKNGLGNLYLGIYFSYIDLIKERKGITLTELYKRIGGQTSEYYNIKSNYLKGTKYFIKPISMSRLLFLEDLFGVPFNFAELKSRLPVEGSLANVPESDPA